MRLFPAFTKYTHEFGTNNSPIVMNFEKAVAKINTCEMRF